MPAVVSDVYDKDRYEQYLQIVSRENRLANVEIAIDTVLDFVLLLTPFFAAIEGLVGSNVYLIFLITALFVKLLYVPVSFACAWWDTFRIENDFGLNKYTRVDFIKDFVRDELFSFALVVVLMEAVIAVCENLEVWVGLFGGDAWAVFLVGILIAATFTAISAVAAVVALKVQRSQYRIEDLPEGDLRSEIESMLATCKKRIHAITVYDESSKSTTKNAMVIGLPWRREISIADNFLNENDYGELIAVLAHEIGHLKHQTFFGERVLQCCGVAIFIICICTAVAWPEPLIALDAWVKQSFGLSCSSYYLDGLIVSFFVSPAAVIIEAITNSWQRKLEYEADREAVRVGHGEDLANMFKKASRDELCNVNPHPLIEMLEYDHPGLANRLSAIYREMGRHC